ncbi:hypothetical protein I4U23_022731 [Adineta vaga]|nr:hypothetical protein I4U23_022731 [Adineta vaga]
MGISVSYNNQMNSTPLRTTINICQCICTLCYSTCCFFLFLFGVCIICLAQLEDESLAVRTTESLIGLSILVTTIYCCKRSCRSLKKYSLTTDFTHEHFQRSNEQYANSNENQQRTRNDSASLPSYRELFPSRLNPFPLSNSQPPSYDDCIRDSDNYRRMQTALSRYRLLIASSQMSTGNSNPIEYV